MMPSADIENLTDDPLLDELLGSESSDIDLQHARAAIRTRLFGEEAPVRIGRFELQSRLGAGGMGAVYAAHDPELDRTIALKLVRLDRVCGLASRREFLRAEARTLARLNHPNVVAVYDVGEVDPILYIAMELVRGPDLRGWLAEPRSVRAILDVFVAIASGVAAAHEVGIVHRDLKPENVLIGDDGRPRVADFGLAMPQARASTDEAGAPTLPDDPHTPASRRAAGTPAYLAPEVLAGGTADARSDQFAFCVCLWEALHGRHPFAQTTLDATLAAIAKGELAEPTRSSVPGWLRAAVRRGLATDPTARWPSIAELAAALGRDRSRRRRRALLAGGITIAIAGAFAFGAMQGGETACAGAQLALDEAWAPAAREQALERIRGFGTYGEATAPRIVAAVDDYAQRWSDGHRDACLAHAREEQSADMLDRRMSCLDRGKAAFAALGDVAAGLDQAVLGDFVIAAQNLPDPADCSELAELGNKPPAPPGASELGERYARLSTLNGLDETETVTREIEPLVAEARALDHPPLLAEVLVLQALHLLRLWEHERAIAILSEALSIALTAGADELAVEAWGQRAWAAATTDKKHPEAFEGRELVVAIATRRPNALSTAQLFLHIGVVEQTRGDVAKAREAFERVIAICEREGYDPTLATAKTNLARVTDDPVARDRLLTDGVAIWTEMAGPEHPRTLSARGLQAVMCEDWEAARNELAATCADYRRFHPALRDKLRNCEQELALVADFGDDRATATVAAGRLVAVSDGEELEWAKGYRALFGGEPGEAAAIFEVIVDRLDANRSADTPWWLDIEAADAETALGRARLELGDPRAAEMFDRSIARYEKIVVDHPTTMLRRRLSVARRYAKR